MAIWSGYGGGLRLQRAVAGPVYVWIEPGDVDHIANRVSAERSNSSLITGDRVSVALVDDAGRLLHDPLPFMAAGAWDDGNRYPDGQWFVNVDPIGGIRFYNSWEHAIKGGVENAMPMLVYKGRCRVRLKLATNEQRCLAQTESWVLNTNREMANITPLGEGFEKNMSTLVSGSGTLECFFSAGRDSCDTDTELEKSIYLHQLILRQEIGSEFIGVFLIKRLGHVVQELHSDYDNKELFYLCNCVITNVAANVETDELVRSRIDFVTTDQIQLLYDYKTAYLLQEGDDSQDKVLQENDSGILVDLPI